MENSSQRVAPLTVSQLTNAIKCSLESTFPSIHLQGEISNFKIQTSGHLYFSLKDAHAQIAAVMFKGDASALKTMPKGGDQVTIKAELNVYPPKGNYQLIVRELAYVGIGELLQQLEYLKIKLHKLGWFKSTHKKPLPSFPKRIGVITSPTGAVIQDILHILTRRFSGFHLILNPVKVQGEGAAEEIAQAIEQMNRYQLADVLIVGRGGGSLEDLWAFNQERVATAIYQSEIPIISAVGHETDHCIADYVADVRAPTPSAAAEIVIAEKKQQIERLDILKKRMQQTLAHLVQQQRYRLQGILKHPLIQRPQIVLEWRMQKLDDYRHDLEDTFQKFIGFKKTSLHYLSQKALALKPSTQIFHLKQRLLICERHLQQYAFYFLQQKRQILKYFKEKLDANWKKKQTQLRHLFQPHRVYQTLFQHLHYDIKQRQQKLSSLSDLLKALNPKNVLEKGYSILIAEKGSFVINSISNLQKGQQAKLLLSDGELLITINEIKSSEQNY